MSANFFNVRSADDTCERMVLSTVMSQHYDAYMQSCYAYVCREIRDNETLELTDEVVLLGMEQGDGVIHAILMREGEMLVDACSDAAILNGDIYQAPSTKGAEPMEMHVKQRISLQDFGVMCLHKIAELQVKPALRGESLKIA